MAVLWAGGEDVDFPNGAAIAGVSTTSSEFRSGYARSAIRANTGSNDVKTESLTFEGGAITTAWLSARLYITTNSTSKRYIGFGKSGGNVGLYVGSDDATNNKCALWKSNGSTHTKLASESGTSLASASVLRIDMSVASYGASATVKVYIGGSEVISFTGDVTIGGATDLDRVAIPGCSSGNPRVSEIIAADEDTRLFSLVTLAPSAAGDTNDWDSGAYTDIDETTINDADLAADATVDENFQVNCNNLPAGTWTIKAVKIAARVSKSAGATAAQIKLGVKSGGSVDEGSAQAASTSWETKERLMTTNPVTTNNWTSSEVDALQLNFRSAA